MTKYEELPNLSPDEPMPTDGKIIETQILDGKIMVGNQPLQGKDLNFVITLDGELVIGRRHVTLSNNKPIIAAGGINIKNGKISQIDPFSGHYKPSNEQAANFPKIFQDLGLPLPQNIKLWGEHSAKPIKYE